MKILFVIIFLSPLFFKCIIFITFKKKIKREHWTSRKRKKKYKGKKVNNVNKIKKERENRKRTNQQRKRSAKRRKRKKKNKKKSKREERYLFNVITMGKKSNWNGGSKISIVFSPNWRESIFVGQGRKYLGPSPTKISPIFHPNQTTPKTLFSPPFSILPIFTPTKWTPKVC